LKATIRQVLQTLNEHFGASVFASPKQFKAVLEDTSIEIDGKKIRNLLNIAICDMKAYLRLETSLANGNPFIVDDLACEMMRGYDIGETSAKTIIESIAELLGFESISSPDHSRRNHDEGDLEKGGIPAGEGKKQNKYHKYYQIVQKAYENYAGHRDEIFISYSKEDKRIVNELIKHLKNLTHNHGIAVWNFQEMQDSANINEEIGRRLKKARVVIQLLSADYINSPYIRKIERPIIKKAVSKNEIEPLLILVGKCILDDTEFEGRQLVGGNLTPLNDSKKYPPAKREELYVMVCGKCRELLGVV